MTHRERLRAALLTLAVLLSACGDDSGASPPSTTAAAPDSSATDPVSTDPVSTDTVSPDTVPAPVGRPYEVSQSTHTFVDSTRSLPAGAQTEAQPVRSIDVWIDLPVTDEPRPLLIFAHGLTGHPRSHEMLRTHLAAEGFVVVSPAFPLTNNDVPGGFMNVGDTGEQVADVTFLIDSVMADPELAPHVDGERVGMIGHSLGGLTTSGAALNAEGDPRITAAVVMSAGYGQVRPGTAVMTVHGDQDKVVPYVSSTASYGLATGRRLLMTLVGGDHLRGILDDDTDHGVALRGVVAAFFAHELGVDAGQVAAIGELPLDDVAIEAGTADGPLDDWRDYFSV